MINIFALHKDPTEAAKLNCDKHVIKMVLELAQLLSTSHRVLDGVESYGLTKSGRRQKRYIHTQELLYKATHINHPSSKYCRYSKQTYTWAAAHLKALCHEYTYRYGKAHKCERIGLVDWLVQNPPVSIPINNDVLLPFPAMPAEYVSEDIVESYRKYYRESKRHLATWAGKVNSRPTPDWFI